MRPGVAPVRAQPARRSANGKRPAAARRSVFTSGARSVPGAGRSGLAPPDVRGRRRRAGPAAAAGNSSRTMLPRCLWASVVVPRSGARSVWPCRARAATRSAHAQPRDALVIFGRVWWRLGRRRHDHAETSECPSSAPATRTRSADRLSRDLREAARRGRWSPGQAPL